MDGKHTYPSYASRKAGRISTKYLMELLKVALAVVIDDAEF